MIIRRRVQKREAQEGKSPQGNPQIGLRPKVMPLFGSGQTKGGMFSGVHEQPSPSVRHLMPKTTSHCPIPEGRS